MREIKLDNDYKYDQTDGSDWCQSFTIDNDIHGVVYEFSTDLARTTIVRVGDIDYFKTNVFGSSDFSCSGEWVSSNHTQPPEWLDDLYYII